MTNEDQKANRLKKNKQEIIEELESHEEIQLSSAFIDLVLETVISGLDEYEQFLKEKILQRFKPDDGHILIMGIPGAGKSTQGKHLAEVLGISYISTGELLREEVKNETVLGLEAKSYMDKGDLVPDELMIAMVAEKLDGQKMCIVDGFPRNESQVIANPDFAKKAIALNLSDENATKRLLGRKLDVKDGEAPRDDDDAVVIAKRLGVYHDQTEPVIRYYREKDALTEVDQEKDDKDWKVFANLIAKLIAEDAKLM